MNKFYLKVIMVQLKQFKKILEKLDLAVKVVIIHLAMNYQLMNG